MPRPPGEGLGAPPPAVPRPLPKGFAFRRRWSHNILALVGGIFFLVGGFIFVAFVLLGLLIASPLPLLFMLAGFVMLRIGRRQAASMLNAFIRGTAAEGKVVSVAQDTSQTMNGAHPWRLTYHFAAGGQLHEGSVVSWDSTITARAAGPAALGALPSGRSGAEHCVSAVQVTPRDCDCLSSANTRREPKHHMKLKRLLSFTAVLMLSGTGVSAQEKEASPASAEPSIFAAATMKWVDGPASLPRGAQMLLLDGDPRVEGPFTMRLKMPAGYQIPPHTHETPERITVISGVVHLGIGEKFAEAAGREMKPGDFAVIPAGVPHFAFSRGEAVLQIHGEGPFQRKFVDPAEDPTAPQK
jgi:quercetin dioxygenase-like cupin family protein